MKNDQKTHFGYEEVSVKDKAKRVADVFHSVAEKYDLMNDLMSLGVHRLWKNQAVSLLNVHSGHKVLDVAGGTGDLTLKIARRVGDSGKVVLSDINDSMLTIGKDRLLDAGIIANIDFVLADAELLPFEDHSFDRIIIGFGLRNVTDKQKALSSLFRVLKPGGRLIILEFSTPTLPMLKPIYDAYSFTVLPWLGKQLLDDSESYRYLAESIRKHPDQNTLKNMMQVAGFEQCDYHNQTGGIIAIHRGYKF